MSADDMADLGEDEKHEIAVSYGSIIGTGLLAIIACSTRLLTRKFVLKAFSVDDWACLVALVLTTAFNGLGIAVVRNGAGRHIEHVSAQELTLWFKLYYACTCLYLIIACAVKSSLLALLWRLFPLPLLHRAAVFLFIFMTLFTVSGTFAAAFQCNPPKYVYDLTYVMSADRAAHCYSPNTAYGVFLYQAVLLFTIDVIIFVYPAPALWGLQMTRGKRLVSVMVFGSAVVACIAPVLRFQSISFYKSGSSDMTYVAASSLYWMAIEYNLGMVAGSLGCLRALLHHFRLGHPFTRKDKLSDPESGQSYELHITDGKNNRWQIKLPRSGGNSSRVQGDSVLDTTRVGNHSAEHILKT